MLYRRGDTWWYKFRFAGGLFRESARTKSKTLARQAERKRHQNLEEAIHGIKKRAAPVTFSTAAWGESENRRRAKYYKLTAVGRREIDAELTNWQRIVAAIGWAIKATS
jgi:hypothetical protein